MRSVGEEAVAIDVHGYPPTEVSKERVYAVGGFIPLRGVESWAPADASGYQPLNTYLVLGDQPLVVDPGTAIVRSQVLDGLSQVFVSDTQPTVFLTRPQLDCVGNLSAVMDRLGIDDVFTGGLFNPFDSFSEATSIDGGQLGSDRTPVERSPDESPLEVCNTALRILATFWGYDADSKTLFTSDSFTHVTRQSPEGPPVLDETMDDSTTIDDVRAHLHATYWWLPYAETDLIVSSLEEVFSTRAVEAIAPDRGCVIVGPELVKRHLNMVLEVLGEDRKEEICH